MNKSILGNKPHILQTYFRAIRRTKRNQIFFILNQIFITSPFNILPFPFSLQRKTFIIIRINLKN